jgi:hypothetical protein
MSDAVQHGNSAIRSTLFDFDQHSTRNAAAFGQCLERKVCRLPCLGYCVTERGEVREG